MRAHLAAVCFALVTLAAPVARAQSNYRLATVGGRTTLVGGTGLVYGHDSASTFLNPATAQLVDKNRLAFSVQAYQFSYMTAGSWYQPGPVDTKAFGDVKREGGTAVKNIGLDSLPGSLCIFFGAHDIPFLNSKSLKQSLKEKGARLGICLATTSYSNDSFNEESYEQQTPQGTSRQAINIRQTFRRLSFGPTYSMYVNNALSIGASLHLTRADHRSLFGATSTTYGGDSGPINNSYYSFARGFSHDMTATLGATYRIGAHQTVALVLESPSLHMFGSGGINEATQYTGPTAASRSFTASGSFVARTPARLALGTGLQRDWGSVELNTSFFPATASIYTASFDGHAITNTTNGATTDQATRNKFTTKALGSVNIGVGGEYFTSPRVSVLGGASFDKTVAPKGSLQSDPLHFFSSRTNRAAISFGYGSHGEGGDLLLGGELSYAWGERLAPNLYQLPARLDVTSQQTFGFLIVLAGSTSFRNIRRVADDVKKMMTPTQPEQPTRSPANPTPVPQK